MGFRLNVTIPRHSLTTGCGVTSTSKGGDDSMVGNSWLPAVLWKTAGFPITATAKTTTICQVIALPCGPTRLATRSCDGVLALHRVPGTRNGLVLHSSRLFLNIEMSSCPNGCAGKRPTVRLRRSWAPADSLSPTDTTNASRSRHGGALIERHRSSI